MGDAHTSCEDSGIVERAGDIDTFGETTGARTESLSGSSAVSELKSSTLVVGVSVFTACSESSCCSTCSSTGGSAATGSSTGVGDSAIFCGSGDAVVAAAGLVGGEEVAVAVAVATLGGEGELAVGTTATMGTWASNRRYANTGHY